MDFIIILQISPDYDSGEKFKTYNYRVSSVPRDDQFQSMEYHPDTGNVDGQH